MKKLPYEFIPIEKVPIATAALSLAVGAVIVGQVIARGAPGRYIGEVFKRCDDGLEGYANLLFGSLERADLTDTGQNSTDVLE